VREVAEAVGVSTGTAINILHDKLVMKNCRPHGCRDCCDGQQAGAAVNFETVFGAI
jgi:hypothetical protein